MGRNPQTHSGQTTGDFVQHAWRSAQHHRQRPGPTLLHQRVYPGRKVNRPLLQLRPIGDVHDDGMIRGSPFGRKDPVDRRHRAGIGGKPVDGLRREGHQTTPAQQFSYERQRFIVRGEQQGTHSHGQPTVPFPAPFPGPTFVQC